MPRFTPAGWVAPAAFLAVLPLFALVFLVLFGDSEGYTRHFLITLAPHYTLTTLGVMVLSACGAAIIGVSTAWLVTRYDFPGRSHFEWLLAMPLGAPAYVLAYAYADLMGSGGVVRHEMAELFGERFAYSLPDFSGVWAVGFIFSLSLYPYVYLIVRSAFLEQAHGSRDAARMLGAGPFKTFFRISLPLARPALATGMALVAMEALADYGTVIHLGATTFTVGVMRAWAGAGSITAAAELALLMLGFAALLLTLERVQRGQTHRFAQKDLARRISRTRLKAWPAFGVVFLLTLPLLFSLGFPVMRLVFLALTNTPPRPFTDALFNSLSLAFLSGVLAALFGFLGAYALRTRQKLARISLNLASLGYAVPGAVAALGLLVIFGAVRHVLMMTPQSAGLGVIGFIALIYAYQTRFAAPALGPCEAAFSKIRPELDSAARSLGASPWRLIKRIHMPLAAGGIMAAWAIVFVETLKELPATMILRPANFETLAVMTHSYASDERLAQAALPSLVLIALCLIPMTLALRFVLVLQRRQEV